MQNSVFFYEPYYDFDRLFEQVFANGANQGSQARRALPNGNGNGDGAVRSFKPKFVPSLSESHGSNTDATTRRMDLHENAETNTVTATFELPGLSKSDVQLDVHNGRLTVAGESKMSSEHEQSGYAVRERRFGKFARVLQLPEGVKVGFGMS
jgi:HSP20 family protein